MLLKFNSLIIAIIIFGMSVSAFARQVGEVSTVFRALGANDKIVVESFVDPQIPEIHCFLSRAKTGGLAGSVGVAEDRSEASISCVKTAPVNKTKILTEIVNGKHEGFDVFKKSTSLTFKTIQVVRFFDKPSNSVIYLTYSDKLIDGSPNNAIFAVSLN